MLEQNSATTMNRREMLKLLSFAASVGMSTVPDKTQAIQTVAMKPIALNPSGGCRGEAFSRVCAD
jgi:hypothetical protein